MAATSEKGSEPVLIFGDSSPVSARISAYLRTRELTHEVSDEVFVSRREIAAELDDKLGALKEQVAELHGAVAGGRKLSQEVERLEGLLATIEKAGEIGRSLSADVVLPPAEELRVKLVPSDSLDRLEEYRADESKAYLLLGAFMGAALGILSNWVTQEAFKITKVSGTLMFVFGCLALLTAAWAHQIGRRARLLRSRLLGVSKGEAGPSRVD